MDLVSLGTTVAEIRVPVTCRYHARLDEPRHLEVRGSECLVRAPAVHPTLPPPIHTDLMDKRSESGWLRFDAAEQMTALERQLTPTFTLRARDRDHIDLVRQTCRRRVAEFVRGEAVPRDWGLDQETTRLRGVAARSPHARTSPPAGRWCRPCTPARS